MFLFQLLLFISECFISETHVQNYYSGTPDPSKEYKYMVVLIHKPTEQFVCSGFLIKENQFITAGKCFDRGQVKPNEYLVNAGITNIRSNFEERYVKEVRWHTYHQLDTQETCLMLAFADLVTPFKLSNKIALTRMPPKSTNTFNRIFGAYRNKTCLLQTYVTSYTNDTSWQTFLRLYTGKVILLQTAECHPTDPCQTRSNMCCAILKNIPGLYCRASMGGVLHCDNIPLGVLINDNLCDSQMLFYKLKNITNYIHSNSSLLFSHFRNYFCLVSFLILVSSMMRS